MALKNSVSIKGINDSQILTNDRMNRRSKMELKLGKQKFISATVETNVDFISALIGFKRCVKEYLKGSTLHGLVYVGDSKLSKAERIFWALAFMMAVLGSLFSVRNLFQKFREAPIIVVLSPTAIDIRKIPFPTVTICNMNNIKKSFADNVLKSVPPGHTSIERQMINTICKRKPHSDDRKSANTTSYKQFVNFFRQASQSCPEMIIGCKWAGQNIDTNYTFLPTLTDEGMCCRFNAVKWDYIFNHIGGSQVIRSSFPFDSFDWTPQRDYTGHGIDWRLPWRPQAHGSNEGLSLYLNTDTDDYFCATGNSMGFKVLFHNPVETVKMTSFASILEPGMETRVAIQPIVKTSRYKVVTMPLEKRKCYFEAERHLRYYRTYSQRNCLNECEANYTRENCNCVHPFMPRDTNTSICEGDGVTCAKQVLKNMAADELHKMNYHCDCLEGCFEVNYSSEQSSCPLRSDALEINTFIQNITVESNVSLSDLAVVHIFFEKGDFIAQERRVLFGFSDLLSTTGGAFSLFTGVSFLSIVEIFYHILKIFFKNRKLNMNDNSNSTLESRVQKEIINHKIEYIP